jgi:hypothetical protein
VRQAEELWAAFSQVWGTLVGPWEDENDKKERADRAAAVQEQAKVFIDKFHKLESALGVYPHVLLSHMPFWIKKFGPVTKYAAQGLEHCHSERKDFMVNSSNNHYARSGDRKTRVNQSLEQNHVVRIATHEEPALRQIRGKRSAALDLDDPKSLTK